MDEKAYFKEVNFKLVREGFFLRDDNISSINVTVAIRNPIKVSTWAAKVSFLVFMGSTSNITKDLIQLFSKSSFDNALKRKDELQDGARSFTAVFPLLASKSIDEDAIKWVRKGPERQMATFELPVVFDLSKGELFYFDRTPIAGAVFYKYFRGFIAANFK